MSNKLGLYIHIPFCNGKCPYCDFYSISADTEQIQKYTDKIVKAIRYWSKQTDRKITSVYFGGGTPNLLGEDNLCAVLPAVFECFAVSKNAEITTELNPTASSPLNFNKLHQAGFNRLSFGLQSANKNELKILGRKHSAEDVRAVVKKAQQGGFENISLDLMLGIPRQTKSSLKKSIEFCAECGVTHISAYILKVEENTPFYTNKNSLNIPDDDTQAELYSYAVDELRQAGYFQYEISNFSKPGFESRHNLTYWECEEYIGIGPAAHSFFEGKRFYYPRSFESFYADDFIFDCEGGSEEEYTMLNLRLNKGIVFKNFKRRFKKDFPAEIIEKTRDFQKIGLLTVDKTGIRLNEKGFLVSNTIISELI